ncbi:Superoxide dismutase [Cu-Zn], chloroplastic [Apostasia shenzhenica]|uniref:Superoxide dismutase copper chaperone n=1 Tax=Apostasia shenzhenica TaxID=1088818 RepID=A0A2I0B1F5_9ASPA|nr:Superoxide dismutase [Cu-Zn], chloroplastic [Apostasia shenzhenica]
MPHPNSFFPFMPSTRIKAFYSSAGNAHRRNVSTDLELSSMGNCVFSGESTVKVATSGGGIMELPTPVTAFAFPGHAIFPSGDIFSRPLLHTDELIAGGLYYLLPLTSRGAAPRLAGQLPLSLGRAPYRVSFDHHGIFRRRKQQDSYFPAMAVGGHGVWKVKLAISPELLADILSQETRTQALIESVRAVVMCGANGSAAAEPSTAVGSDQCSPASSRKTSSENAGSAPTLTAATLLPAAAAAAAFSSSFRPSCFPSSRFPAKPDLPSASSLFTAPVLRSFDAVSNSSRPHAALHMDSTVTDVTEQTEFMVDMSCEGCVSAVKSSMLQLHGGYFNLIIGEFDLLFPSPNHFFGFTASDVTPVVAESIRKRHLTAVSFLLSWFFLVEFLISAAVAEFKGPILYGVVRLAQVKLGLARIEASFSGLSPGRHGWSINEYGDLTRGAASTGKIFNPTNHSSVKPLGDLGTLDASENGEAQFSGSKEELRVSDLIGRSIVVYENDDKLESSGIAAAVIARSAGVGENYKKICTCDGVTIWEST